MSTPEEALHDGAGIAVSVVRSTPGVSMQSTTSRRRYPALSISLAALLLAIASCGSDELLAPNIDVAGSYTLRQVDGHLLPRTISFDGASRVEILAGSVMLEPDSTWLGRTEFRITTPSGTSTDTHLGSGRWSLDRFTVVFDAAGAVVGTISGDTLRVVRREGGAETSYLYTR